MELGPRDELPPHRLLVHLPVVHEARGRAVDHLLETVAVKREPGDQCVGAEDGAGAEQSAEHGVVGADHRVLQDVAHDQQDDQVERRQRSDLSLPRHAEHHQEEDVDDERAHDLLHHPDFRQPHTPSPPAAL